MRLNWLRSRRTSSSPVAARACRCCCKRRAPCRSCSRSSRTRLALATLIAWRARAATPPASSCSNTARAGNGWRCSRRLRRGGKRVAVLRDPTIASGIGQLGAIQSAAPALGMEVSPVNVRDVGEIERNIAALAHSSNGGVVVTASPEASRHRGLIVTLTARHRLPAVYPYRSFIIDGGLISYGPDMVDQYRRAAAYVGRILNGEKPADLPVQAPIKFELVINLKTAKALGLDVSPQLLAHVDEVIE